MCVRLSPSDPQFLEIVFSYLSRTMTYILPKKNDTETGVQKIPREGTIH